MKFFLRRAFLCLVCIALAIPVSAQNKPAGAELPLTQIVLFNSGVGYFQREGQVDGNARVDLQFPVENVKDLLKSLILQDLGNGQISTISYDSRNPLEKTLKSFALDLTSNPSLAEILNQARGETVEVLVKSEKGSTESLKGLVVGVEKQKQPVGKEQVIEIAYLNLLSDEGLRAISLNQVQKLRFLKPALDVEFRKALAVLATGHDREKKTVTLNFNGQGKRSVRLGYVTESPLWKTSYRLSIDKDQVFLQGWAIVENTTDEDWNHVQMGLVSGRPISFQMDLYQPLFISRPVVEPDLYASVRPPSFEGDLKRDGNKDRSEKGGAEMPAPMMAAPMGGFGGRSEAESLGRGLAQKKASLNFQQGVASAATTTNLGEYFEYVIREPVSLARQKSALLPIVNQAVSGKKLSIYNETVHAQYPLLGLRFKNNTSLHLTQGPVTIFEKDVYAGDARLPDLKPKESRLLAYAIDLGTEVEPRVTSSENLMAVKIFKGILQATYKLRETKLYTIKNRGEEPRQVLIEHPIRQGFNLVSPQKPEERSRSVYRFVVEAPSNQPVKQEVIEELPRLQQIALTNFDDDTIRFYLQASVVSDKVKKALEKALELKGKVAELQLAVASENKGLHDIEQDQVRMRANMARVPPTSEAYKRYLKKFDDQETEIEKRQTHLAKLQEAADKERKVYEEFLRTLDAD